MELHELEIRDLRASSQCKCNTVTCGDVRVSGLPIYLTEAAGGQNYVRSKGSTGTSALTGTHHVQGDALRSACCVD